MRWRRKLEKDENYVTSLSLITSVTISTGLNTIVTTGIVTKRILLQRR